ncbi:glycosyltransferase family 4 protein [Lichenibacterium ramalinae]|uniref:glycosyltransferase family 4 protein n=1 Tax=Lichenibacterium ramalinae TaxID=2316527 RepID=UPI001FE08083|nr:glycosyltransferase family 4 protein [Lichenibacterium ramalinae]
MSRRPLRIALVQTQAENAGAQEISRILARGLEARGHAVRQIFFFRRTASFDAVENARVVCRTRPSSPWAVLGFLVRLRRMLREARPDVVLTFQHYGNVIGAPVARAAGCRFVVANQVSAGAVVHPLVSWADAVLGSLGFYGRIVINSDETAAAYSGHTRAYRRLIRHIDHGFEDKTASVPARDARAALNLPQDVPLLGCASRLHPMKQLDCAVRLLAIRPAYHLTIAGQGSDRDRLEQLAATLGVTERLHFVGELDPGEIGVFLAGLDAFLHPSAAETFGLAPVEAAQAGVPVICNDIPVLREVLQTGGEPCALFADVQDPEALAGTVDSILTDPVLADNLRARGRRLSERYPVDAMIDDYARLIDELVGDGTSCASRSSSAGMPFGAGRSVSVND